MEVAVCIEVLSWLLPGGTKGNHDKFFFQSNWTVGCD